MQFSNEKQLEGWYRDNSLPIVCLLYGEDSYRIEKQCEKLRKLAVTAFDEFNLYTVDGRVTIDIDALVNSALSLPFMSDSRAVIIDDFDVAAQTAAVMDKLFTLIKSPSDTTCLIITVRTVDFDLKKKNGKAYKLWELCDRTGVVCQFQKPTRTDVARILSTGAVKAGCRLDSAAANLLADSCGNDILRGFNELDKLIAYVGQGDISCEVINLLVEPVTEAKVFDLSAKLLKKDLQGALGVVTDLFFQRERPESILTILSMSFSDIYRAYSAKKAGIPAAQAQKDFGYFGGGVFRYSKASESLARLSDQALPQIIRILAEADLEMKQSGASSSVILESTIVKIYTLL